MLQSYPQLFLSFMTHNRLGHSVGERLARLDESMAEG